MKKFKILILLLICFSCLTVSFAASDNTNTTVSNNNHQVSKVSDVNTTQKVAKVNSRVNTTSIKKDNPKNNEFSVTDANELEKAMNWINTNGTAREYTINLIPNPDAYYEYLYIPYLGNNHTKSVIINANNNQIDPSGVLNGYSLTLNDLVIKDRSMGRNVWTTTGYLKNFGNLTLNNCTLISNSAYDYVEPIDDWDIAPFTEGIGGALYNEGNLTINNSVFKNNIAGINGSAIMAMGNNSNIVLTNNIFNHNFFGKSTLPTRGAIYIENAQNVLIRNNSFINNMGDTAVFYLKNNTNVILEDNYYYNNKGNDSLITIISSKTNMLNQTFLNNNARSIIESRQSEVKLSKIKASNNNGNYFIQNYDNGKVILSQSALNNKMESFNHNKNSMISNDNYKLNKRLNTTITLNRTLLNQNQLFIDVNLTDVSGKVKSGVLTIRLNDKKVYNTNFTGKTIKYYFNKRDLKTVNRLTVTYSDTGELFANRTLNTNFTRNIINTKTSINHTYVRPKANVLLNASVTDVNGKIVNEGVVVFKLNGVTLKDGHNQVYYVNVRNGFAQLNYYVSTLNTKDYTFTAVYKGSINYNTSRTNNILTVHKNKTIISILTNPSSVVNGRNIKFTAYLKRADNKPVNDGKVIFKLNGITIKDKKGKAVSVKVINGQASLTTTIYAGTSAKTYRISAVYSGTTENSEARTINYTFQVLKDDVNVNLAQNTFITKKGQNTKISGQILNSLNQNTKRDHKISIKINNKTVIHTITKNGFFNVTLPTSQLSKYDNNITLVVGENNAYKERRINCKIYIV